MDAGISFGYYFIQRNKKEFQVLKPKIHSWVFLDQICPFSSNNFTDRLVSPIQTGQWLCCHATYHDNQSVILSRSLIATQLLVPPSSLFPCLYVHVSESQGEDCLNQ